MGRAAVHDRQALVLVNRGGATGAEILDLARQIQSDVRATYGVALEPEPVVLRRAAPSNSISVIASPAGAWRSSGVPGMARMSREARFGRDGIRPMTWR